MLAALIENSLMHGGGTVALRTRVTGNQAVIEVTDEGPGVPADLGARIFERAISGRNSTGIGLAVARDLAEADGGRLEMLQAQPPVFGLFLSRTPQEAGASAGQEPETVRLARSANAPRTRRGSGGRSGQAGRPALQERFGAGHGLAGRERAEHPGAVGPEAEQRRDPDAEELEEVALQRAVQPKP